MKLYRVITSFKLKNTAVGNPRYAFTLEDSEGNCINCTTKPNAQFTFQLTQYGFSQPPAYITAELKETKKDKRGFYMVDAQPHDVE